MYYRLIKGKVLSETGEEIFTYGVKFTGGEVPDITFEREKMAQRIRLFNRLRLAPEHLMDAVYDLMCESNAMC